MNDVQDEIRGMLNAKAADVPPHLDVPPSLARRVWPRIARNAVLVAASVAVLTVVGVAGVRSLNEPVDQSLGQSPATPAGPQTCERQALEATLLLEGAAGSREGAISLRNASGGACTLSGTPEVDLIEADGSPVDIDLIPGLPAWKIDRAPEPQGWPLVVLDPGETGSVRLRWSNWCPPTAPTLRLTASDRTVVAEIQLEPVDVPPCNGPDPSTIEVGPFEPAG